jgi:heme-degrading monooxygenase HmoA
MSTSFVATYLPLKTLKAFPRFAGFTLKIRKQLEQAPGVVGYSLSADLRRFNFYTLSAWESPEHIRLFMLEEPHRAAMKWERSEKSGMGRFTSMRWTGDSSEVPPDWDDAVSRLREPS